MMHGLALGIVLSMLASHVAAMRVVSVPRPAAEDQVKDRFRPASYERQRIGGLLGERLGANLEQSLLRADANVLLAPYRKFPASQPCAGEYPGRFLRAASWAWAYSGDHRLRSLLQQLAQGLIAAQGPDGYLGVHTGDRRWTGFDVAAHSSSLTGLLAYYEVTGDADALRSARRIGDLLTQAFARGEGQRDLLRAGDNAGVAAAGLLEPACLLYRFSGEKRNLTTHLLGPSGGPGGTRLIEALKTTGSVNSLAGTRADDLLSGLVGLLELYRLSGEEQFLEPVLAAWRDIVSKRLYITGTTSTDHYFRDDHVLPGEQSMAVGEACATVNWLQLNWHLLRLTGEPRYADQLERTIYNQLLAVQDPRAGAVSASAPLMGRKRPEQGVTCCTAHHPLGIALLPQIAWGTREGALTVLLYVPGEAIIPVSGNGGGLEVQVTSETRFPLDGAVTLTLRPPHPARFAVALRVPAWCRRYRAAVNGTILSGQPGSFLRIDRFWQPGEQIRIHMDMSVRVLPGGASYPNHVAFQRGPQVLALEAAANPQVPFLHRAAPASLDGIDLPDATVRLPKEWRGVQAYALPGLAVERPERGRQAVVRTELLLVPFAEARDYRVWLPRPERVPVGPVAVTAFASESWSHSGDLLGSICDERSDTFRVTLNGAPSQEDWYAVEMDRPELIDRVVYRHGRVFPNGGWFSTAAGKPVIQIKRMPESDWETIATLDSYPDTTAGPDGLSDGQPFEVKLQRPVSAVAVRVLGHPGGAFSSCAELAAYRP